MYAAEICGGYYTVSGASRPPSVGDWLVVKASHKKDGKEPKGDSHSIIALFVTETDNKGNI